MEKQLTEAGIAQEQEIFIVTEKEILMAEEQDNQSQYAVKFTMDEMDVYHMIMMNKCKDGDEKSLRLTKLFFCGLGLFMIMFSLLIQNAGGLPYGLNWIFSLLGLYAIIMPLIVMTPRHTLKQAKKAYAKSIGQLNETCYKITDEALLYSHDQKNAIMKWEEIHSYKITEFNYFIYPNSKFYYMIPKRMFISAPDLKDLLHEKLKKINSVVNIESEQANDKARVKVKVKLNVKYAAIGYFGVFFVVLMSVLLFKGH